MPKDITAPAFVRSDEFPWLANWTIDRPLLHDVTDDGMFRAPRSGVEYEGRTWSVATNGRVVFFVDDGHGIPDTDGLVSSKLHSVLESAHAARTFSVKDVSVPDLKRAVGLAWTPDSECECKAMGLVACESCGGVGWLPNPDHFDDDAECDACAGYGSAPCYNCSPPGDIRTLVRMCAGGVFNKDLLRVALRYIPDGPATWTQGPTDGVAMLRGAGYMVAIMPVRPQAASEYPVTPFPQPWTP
ncbi:MAG: hypothetical protein ABI119_03310 [Gemmatimonadaceae bacterium]